MIVHRLLHRLIYRSPLDEGESGGAPAVVDTPAADTPAAADTSAAPAQPASMLDAINRHFTRDEQGRFASPAEQAAADAAAKGEVPAVKAAAPVQTVTEEDPTAMPEGLGQKAQERFQKLTGTVKDLTQQADQLRSQVSYVQEQFQQHGVQREQFEQAVGVIGMLNRGDYRAALQMLDQQRAQIALQLGEPLPGVDALAQFPDLRQRVDGLQMSEADALEMARMRQAQQVQQQRTQATQQAQQLQQAEQHAVQQATATVDAWWRQVAATDIDAPAIEAQLLPHLGELLQGVPPAAWAQVVQAQYKVLKGAAGAFRKSGAGSPTPAPLRPTGAGAQMQRRPGSMYEAMWAGR